MNSNNPSGYDVTTGKFADASAGPARHLAPSTRLSALAAGAGCFSSSAGGATVFYSRRQRAIPASGAQTPFQVLSASNDDSSGLYIKFNQSSYLFKSPDVQDLITITDLDTTGLSVEVGDWVFIEIDNDATGTMFGVPGPSMQTGPWPGNVPSSATVQYTVNPGTGGIGPVIPFVSAWFTPVAKIVDSTDTTPGATAFASKDGTTKAKIIQLLNTNLLLVQWALQTVDYGGLVATLGLPWTGTDGA